jgi:hypothetical protein
VERLGFVIGVLSLVVEALSQDVGGLRLGVEILSLTVGMLSQDVAREVLLVGRLWLIVEAIPLSVEERNLVE